ncbi:S-methyl-5-thioribose kinase [Pseudoalteromonas peptidolytica]|uniref:S-methyl-5-thioribose kinase n=1 Tax=Pseudoalteromonas peptidolytica TaxID=61150 RepID=UPI00298D816E|nr:S-methyl-5-thioribose kinase [Pseudoalteromonas peptidolytica]MDW7551180.1 S-methyl-5-thioribose kinase [Pseudoalteromonas peptidolytica]
MSGYVAFDAEKVIDYVTHLGHFFAEGETLSCYEFGDGNLNLVFRVQDTQRNSIIVKQALPYARCVGESWPLTLDRARIEASVLRRHGEICPTTTAKVLHHNSELAVTILEDLGQLHILRGELNQAHTFPQLSQDIATYLAKTSFYFSSFYLEPSEKKALVTEFTNPELCAITEDLFFDDPYRDTERNHFPGALQASVNTLRHNKALLIEIAKLKAQFLNAPETLLHGDVHTGSIFVSAEQTKLIDPEFGFFGPIGFDLGSFIGNLLLNYCAQHARIEALPKRRNMQVYLLDCIASTLSGFYATWLKLAKTQTRDLSLQAEGYAEYFLTKVLQDAVGYCGCELIRRTIGLAHVTDIDDIEDDTARLEVQKRALQLGEQLILNANKCHTTEDVYQLIISFVN